MKSFLSPTFRRGQTSLEYLLLLAVVAVVVIASFSPGSLVDQIRHSAGGYYNTVTSVVMDSDGGTRTLPNGTVVSIDTPDPINGGWCPMTCPPSGSAGFNIMYRSCECPAPAFGGKTCTDNSKCPAGASCSGPQVMCGAASGGGVAACGPCPTGQTCNAQGKCACANNLTCPANSSPDEYCSTCDCNIGTVPSGSSCKPCTASNGQCMTSTGSGSCFAATVPPNMNCNTTTNTFQCNTGTVYALGPGCTACQPTATGQCTTSNNGQTCVALTGRGAGGCATNMYCDTVVTDANYNSCQCDENPAQNFYTYWDGTQCAAGAETCSTSHPCNACTSCVSGVCLANSRCVIKS